MRQILTICICEERVSVGPVWVRRSKYALLFSLLLSLSCTSKDNFLQEFKAAMRILVPVAVPPVKEMRGTLGWAAKQAPTRSPRPNTMLTTPGGTPARPMALKYWYVAGV